MHIFVYLLSLLFVTLSADGLGLPPGRQCVTKPCDVTTEDSRVNERAARDTTATDTAINNTAINNIATNNTAINNTRIDDTAITAEPDAGLFLCNIFCVIKKLQIDTRDISKKRSAKHQIDFEASKASHSS